MINTRIVINLTYLHTTVEGAIKCILAKALTRTSDVSTRVLGGEMVCQWWLSESNNFKLGSVEKHLIGIIVVYGTCTIIMLVKKRIIISEKITKL